VSDIKNKKTRRRSGVIETGSGIFAEYQSGSGSRTRSKALMTKNWKKLTAEKTSNLPEKPLAPKREHPAIQNLKFLILFLLSWIIFDLLDPDPASEFGSTNPNEVITDQATWTRIRIHRPD
jgi:hypothetical protein